MIYIHMKMKEMVKDNEMDDVKMENNGKMMVVNDYGKMKNNEKMKEGDNFQFGNYWMTRKLE